MNTYYLLYQELFMNMLHFLLTHFLCIANVSRVAAVNRGDVKDSDIDAIMDSIVDSLFSVFVNLGK